MVIQNKIILPQFAYTEHIHKKRKFCLSFNCTKPALLKFMDENVMRRSLDEKVRKKVMNEQRKTQMNTRRTVYNQLKVFLYVQKVLLVA